MTRFTIWSMHLSNLLVAITGISYAVMRYCLKPIDEFSILNHPWQGAMLEWHVLLAPSLVFVVGLIWRGHVLAYWRYGMKRRLYSGALLMFIAAPMIISGYFIQVTIEELWRSIWLWVHLITAGLWVMAYLVHCIRKVKRL